MTAGLSLSHLTSSERFEGPRNSRKSFFFHPPDPLLGTAFGCEKRRFGCEKRAFGCEKRRHGFSFFRKVKYGLTSPTFAGAVSLERREYGKLYHHPLEH
jgi:hypothetical protein